MEDKSYCECCKQALFYFIDIDKGTTMLLKKLSVGIKMKTINAIHPRKELEGVALSSNEVGNLSRARFHGLIAKIKEHAGNYCITDKGFKYLAGMDIPLTVKIAKGTKDTPPHTVGYGDEMVNIKSFDKPSGRTWGEYWSANGYEIRDGNVIVKKKEFDQEEINELRDEKIKSEANEANT